VTLVIGKFTGIAEMIALAVRYRLRCSNHVRAQGLCNEM